MHKIKENVYIETSVISYLCARPSRDLIVAANQEVTRQWWDRGRGRYDCYVSALVLEEASSGDADAAAKRRVVIAGLKELAISKPTTPARMGDMTPDRNPNQIPNPLTKATARSMTASIRGARLRLNRKRQSTPSCPA